MTGVVLAGGNGTRLRPMTEIVNKHLLPVYDRPMIEYPIETLKQMGCDSIVLVSGGENIGGFADYLGDGSRLGVQITYKVQKEADGIAGALKCAEGLITGTFPVILGDNFFELPPRMFTSPTLYLSLVPDANRFGVYLQGKIVEKPAITGEGKAVVGLYIYDESVFTKIDTITPSDRGELEITDINNMYLADGARTVTYEGKWSDMGTVDSLMDTANFVLNTNKTKERGI